MNLNITTDDLRRGKYEAQKTQLLNKLVRHRSIVGDPEDGALPSNVVCSQLLDGMLQACFSRGVAVVHADRGLGKSTAAKYILKLSGGGVMFCNCDTPSSGCYWKGVAQAVGIPKVVYEETSEWERLLVDAVAAATSPEQGMSKDSWIDRLMDKSISLCGGNVDEVPEVIPSLPGLDLSFLRKNSIMVFDDFNSVGEDDIKFMKSLYPIVEAKGVLLFVLVRDEHTANQLLRLNNWGRIFPLPAICEDVSGVGGKEKIPQWKLIQWTQAQLEEVVRAKMGEIPTNMPEIPDGSNPLDILARAREIALRAQAGHVALQTSKVHSKNDRIPSS